MKIRDILTTLAEQSLSEYRRGGEELNPKTSINAAIAREYDAAEKIGPGVKNLFVSFTDLEKLGVNPRSRFKTPVGIYAYTGEYSEQMVTDGEEPRYMFPFAADRPYVNTFSLKPNASVLFVNSTTNLDQYYDQLRNWYGDEEIDALIAAEMDEASVPSVGGRFWFTLHALSNNSKLWPSRGYRNPAVRWTHLLRRLGIDVVVDTGAGIIHPNEPSQIVVVNPAVITNVHRHYNKYSPGRDVDVSTPVIFRSSSHKAAQQKLNREYLLVKDDYDKLLHWLASKGEDSVRPKLSSANFFKFVSPDWRAKMLMQVPCLANFLPIPTLSDAQAVFTHAVNQLAPISHTYTPDWTAPDLEHQIEWSGASKAILDILSHNPKMVVDIISKIRPIKYSPGEYYWRLIKAVITSTTLKPSDAFEFYSAFLTAFPLLVDVVVQHVGGGQYSKDVYEQWLSAWRSKGLNVRDWVSSTL